MKRAELQRLRDDARAMREFAQRVEAVCAAELEVVEKRATRVHSVGAPAPANDDVATDLEVQLGTAILRRHRRGRG